MSIGVEEANSVTLQLTRLLESHHFKHSRHYPKMLQYIVEKTLAGEHHDLKERTIGVEVFGREPTYDTAEDPVVRVTAGKLRERIAQYYHEPAHVDELRIDLPVGSYVAEFGLPSSSRTSRAALTAEETVYEPHSDDSFKAKINAKPSVALELTGVDSGSRRSIMRVALVVVSVVICAVTWAGWSFVRAESVAQAWWRPILKHDGQVLIAIGQLNGYDHTARQGSDSLRPNIYIHEQMIDRVNLADAVALGRLCTYLGAHNKPSKVLGSENMTLSDARANPNILISGFDNPWTMRVTDTLRFHFVHPDAGDQYLIEDRKNPTNMAWEIDSSTPYSALTQDYAIVARLIDPLTGSPTLVAAGIGENGTLAASEVIANDNLLNAFLPPGKYWHAKNIEMVIATQVIDGHSGPPKVVGMETW